MAGVLKYVIVMAIVLIVAAQVLPAQIYSFVNANQTGWDAGTVALLATVIVMIIIGLFLKILDEAGIKVR